MKGTGELWNMTDDELKAQAAQNSEARHTAETQEEKDGYPTERKIEEKPSPQYDTVVREISRLEDTGFKDEVKISKIIDEVERAQKNEEISPDEAAKILPWYGL